MSLKSVPSDLRGLRACLVCSMIKTFDQFESDGCDNCDEFLRMKNNRDNVYDCTSSNFDGMIAVMSPEDSWVCKWQRIRYNNAYGPASCQRKSAGNDHTNNAEEGSLVRKTCRRVLLDRFCKGVYAISVSGRLPTGIIREMKSRGIVYKPRDTSQR